MCGILSNASGKFCENTDLWLWWSCRKMLLNFISGAYCAVINMNPNRAFCFVFAPLLLQIIDMQQLQMFACHPVSEMGKWIQANPEVAFIRRPQHFRRICVAPFTWTIPRPAESWFDSHYLSPLLFLRPFVVLFLFFFLFVPNLQLTWSWSGYRSPLPHLPDYRTD